MPQRLPAEIIRKAVEKYYDTLTDHLVAVKKVKLKDRVVEIAVTYDESRDSIAIITIHPLKGYQKVARIRSGRWKKL